MIVNFLAAADNTPLTKTFSSHFGTLSKSAYPNVRDFNSASADVNSIEEFHAALFVHAQQNYCLVKGRLTKELNGESRRGATDPHNTTQWMCFDIDHLPGITDAEQFISLLPLEFHNASYVLQFSSSHGFSDEPELRAHIFFLLNNDTMPSILKLWMKRLNLTTASFKPHLRLAEGGCTLKWPVDISVNQNDKLIYVAPPLCLEGVTDPVALEDRIRLVSKTQQRVVLDTTSIQAEAIRTLELETLNALREASGLEKKRFKVENLDGYSVIRNADQMTLIAPPFTERDFVYMPIGSNRHTYYHPVGKHEFLYSFKDPDIAFPMQTVLPSYYWEQERRESAVNNDGRTILAFRDRRSDVKYIGSYSADRKLASFNQIKAREDIDDFFTQNRHRAPDIIETWDYEFDPTRLTRIDPEARWINKFIPSMYIEAAAAMHTPMPRKIELLLRHLMNYDDDCYEHFINWLAYKFQTRNKCKTAWFFQGVEGTGKGVLFNKVLSPLFGNDYCHLKRMDNLLDRFNAELETSLIWVIDEANIENFRDDGQILEKLKNLIVEDMQVIRAMRTNQYNAVNYTDVILFSNQSLAIKISPTDRRYNICPRQNTPLLAVMPRETIATLDRELPQFAGFLASYEVNTSKVAEPMDNQAKRDLITISRTTHDDFIQSIMAGDLLYLIRAVQDGCSDSSRVLASASITTLLKDYVRTVQHGQPTTISVSDIAKYYAFIVSGAKNTSLPVNKMARMLALRGCVVNQTNDEFSATINVTWTYNELAVQRWLTNSSNSSLSSSRGSVNEQHQQSRPPTA